MHPSPRGPKQSNQDSNAIKELDENRFIPHNMLPDVNEKEDIEDQDYKNNAAIDVSGKRNNDFDDDF